MSSIHDEKQGDSQPDTAKVMLANLLIPQSKIADFCQQHHIRKLALFGSILRDDFTPESDVDVLVEFEPGSGITYLDMVDIQDALTELIGRPVDLLTPAALSPYFRQQVLDSAVVIYERT